MAPRNRPAVVRLPDDRDPDEIIRDDPDTWRKATEDPQPIMEFLIDRAASRHDPSTVGGREKLVADVLPTLRTISDPNVAYILMMIGLAGLYFELSHPGAIFPGVVGGISIILAFFAFQTLPVSTAGSQSACSTHVYAAS